MKNSKPRGLGKYILSLTVIFLTLFFVNFAFLSFGPKIYPVANAAGCTSSPGFLAPGNNINVSGSGTSAGLNINIALNSNAPITIGQTDANSFNKNLLIPRNTPNGVYTVYIDALAFGSISCGVVTITEITTCGFSYNTAPIAPGSSLSVQVSGQPADTFQGTFIDSQNQPSGNGSGIMPPTGPLTFKISPAPTTPGTYRVFIVDKDQPQNVLGCASTVGTNQITVGNANPTPTPQPTPGTGCNIVPTNNSWGTLQTPTVSGNNVTFDLSSNPPAGKYGVIIEDASTGAVPTGGGSGPLNQNTWQLTLPDGSYCAAVFYGTAAVSNVVPFTVPSGDTGDTCSSSALNWVNDFRCRAIGGGWFDSDVFTAGQTVTTLESFNFIVWGESPMNQRWATDTTRKTGALAFTGNMVSSLYSAPPASGVQYFAQKIHDLNPVTPAYAAAGGIGYQTLGPVQKIWIAFRNIAYVGFIIVFVIMGFMIMFRAHISPQAVATVQDSIPRLVIALILVTFSYAIAGFMIDIMFVMLNVLIQALVATKLISNADFIFKDNVFTVIWSNWGSVFKHVAFAIKDLIGGALDLPGGFVGDIVEKTLKWTGGGLAALIIGIALLFIMFRIFLMLLMAYVMIILLTMFAPFFFLIQALPGNNGAKEWFRQMASNIAVFPTVALMFVFAGILGGIGNLTGGGTGGPAIQSAQIGQFPLIIGNLNSQAIGELIGIGFLLLTPSAADIVKNAMGGKGGGGGAMGAAAPAMAALGASAGFLGRRVSESSPGRAVGALSKAGGEQRAEWIMKHAPSPLKPRGVKEPKFSLPTLQEKK